MTFIKVAGFILTFQLYSRLLPNFQNLFFAFKHEVGVEIPKIMLWMPQIKFWKEIK